MSQHGRPASLAYDGFVSKLVETPNELAGEWSEKKDGYNMRIRKHPDLTRLTYHSKGGHAFTEDSVDEEGQKCLGKHRIFTAMERYMRDKLSYLDPHQVRHGRRVGMELVCEFCVYRKDCPKGYDDLRALMFGLCLTADGDLDLETYVVEVIVFDVVFDSYPEKADPPYHERIECVREAFNGMGPYGEFRNHIPWRLFGRSDVLEVLTDLEGVVVCLSKNSVEHWLKIKPNRPVGLEIVGVLDTVGTNGYDKILVAATDGENRRKVVDMIDLASIFTEYERAKQGKAYVNPASIRRDPVSGAIDCTSSSSLRPFLSALFGRISSTRLIRPVVVSPTEVRVRGTYTVTCGAKRSFHRWFSKMQFLEHPQPITMSANGFWVLPKDEGEVHLQAARVLSVGNYGPEHFQNLPPMSHETLLHIAFNRLEKKPRELFRLAGVKVAPFADFPQMGDRLFMPQ